jgi:hypothetical protein
MIGSACHDCRPIRRGTTSNLDRLGPLRVSASDARGDDASHAHALLPCRARCSASARGLGPANPRPPVVPVVWLRLRCCVRLVSIPHYDSGSRALVHLHRLLVVCTRASPLYAGSLSSSSCLRRPAAPVLAASLVDEKFASWVFREYSPQKRASPSRLPGIHLWHCRTDAGLRRQSWHLLAVSPTLRVIARLFADRSRCRIVLARLRPRSW